MVEAKQNKDLACFSGELDDSHGLVILEEGRHSKILQEVLTVH